MTDANQDGVTSDEIEATYKVIEQIRENALEEDDQKLATQMDNAHSIVQEYELETFGSTE